MHPSALAKGLSESPARPCRMRYWTGVSQLPRPFIHTGRLMVREAIINGTVVSITRGRWPGIGCWLRLLGRVSKGALGVPVPLCVLRRMLHERWHDVGRCRWLLRQEKAYRRWGMPIPPVLPLLPKAHSCVRCAIRDRVTNRDKHNNDCTNFSSIGCFGSDKIGDHYRDLKSESRPGHPADCR